MFRDGMEKGKWLLSLGLDLDQMRVTMRSKPLCVAPLLDPSESASCSGRSTLDHVKDAPRMGKRAPSDPAHLVTLCEFHHLGSKAGRNWATANRPALRAYLAKVEAS